MRMILLDGAHHVITCHLTHETRVQSAFDDVTSTVHQTLARGDRGVQVPEFLARWHEQVPRL